MGSIPLGLYSKIEVVVVGEITGGAGIISGLQVVVVQMYCCPAYKKTIAS